MEQTEIKRIIEALLFVATDYVTVDKLSEIIEMDKYYIEEGLKALVKDYDESQSALMIKSSEDGVKFFTKPIYAPYIKRLLYPRQRHGLSQAALEALSIIAVKQPVTKAHIEEIRGVNTDGAVQSLLEKNLIEMKGRLEVPGKPAIYGTTNLFLDYFHLENEEMLKNLLEEKPKKQLESSEPEENSEETVSIEEWMKTNEEDHKTENKEDDTEGEDTL